MAHENETIEATLFFPSDPGAIFGKLGARLARGFSESGLKVSPKLTSDTDLVLELDGMTVALSQSGGPLEIGNYAGAERPEAATTPERVTMSRLFRHQAAVRVRVTGETADMVLPLCYVVALQVARAARPDLVHWSQNTTLYTVEEFLSSTGAHTPVRPRPATSIRRRSVARTRRPTPTRMPPRVFGNVHEERHRLAAMRKGSCPSDRIQRPGATPPPTRLQSAMSQGAVMGLTASLSLGVALNAMLAGFKIG